MAPGGPAALDERSAQRAIHGSTHAPTSLALAHDAIGTAAAFAIVANSLNLMTVFNETVIHYRFGMLGYAHRFWLLGLQRLFGTPVGFATLLATIATFISIVKGFREKEPASTDPMGENAEAPVAYTSYMQAATSEAADRTGDIESQAEPQDEASTDTA